MERPIELDLAQARVWGVETPRVRTVLPPTFRRFELEKNREGNLGISSRHHSEETFRYISDPDPQKCLREFVNLTRKPPSAKLRFARRWGGRLFECHDHRWPPPEGECPFCDYRLPDQSWGEGWEAVAHWDTLIAEYIAVLRLAADLDANRPTKEADWTLILGSLPQVASAYPRQKGTVAWYVSVQLQLAKIWPDFDVDPRSGRWEFRLHGVGLRALLAVGLATVLNGGGVYRCDLCGSPFSVAGRRRRQTGPNKQPVNNYCPPPRTCAADGRKARARARWAERD